MNGAVFEPRSPALKPVMIESAGCPFSVSTMPSAFSRDVMSRVLILRDVIVAGRFQRPAVRLAAPDQRCPASIQQTRNTGRKDPDSAAGAFSSSLGSAAPQNAASHSRTLLQRASGAHHQCLVTARRARHSRAARGLAAIFLLDLSPAPAVVPGLFRGGE